MQLMKSRILLASIIFVFAVISCKKNDHGTTYKTMGSFSGNGLPGYLTTPDVISQGLTDYLDTTLINGNSLVINHPEFFQGYTSADINITQTSNVSITYLSSINARANALGFYSYSTATPPATAADIKTITYVFPNTGPGTPLTTGDKVVLGKFNASSSIGIVVFSGGWDSAHHRLNNNSDIPRYYTTDILNPETDSTLRKHAVKIPYAPENKTIIGFEDYNRESPACDNDFNDVVFYLTVTPAP